MKKKFTKILSLFLVILMLMTMCLISGNAAGQEFKENQRTTVPTVYVKGFGHTIYKDKNNKDSEKIYTNRTDVKPETYQKLFDGFMDPLMDAIKTDKWSDYSDFIVNTVIGDLSRFKLDKNGEASDNSGNDCDHDNNPTDRKVNGTYDLYDYYFVYDQRLDPYKTAEELNEYIEKVKDVTGFDKVNLFGRCFGTTIVMAYLDKYGYDNINAVELYIGMFHGLDTAGALFSGQACTDPLAWEMFCERNLPDTDDMTVVKALVDIMYYIKALDLPIELVYKAYDEVYENVIPRLLLNSYATMPGYWTCVGPEYYEAAKEFLFGGHEAEYAGIIEKIDNYHNNVMLKTDEILQRGIDKGVCIYNFTKYGGVMAPCSKEALEQSDDCTSIESQALGTECADLGSHFGYKHMNTAEKEGNLKYISADRLLDASGDFLRDHTWFAKGLRHETMPASYDRLMANVFEATGYGDNKNYVTVDYFEDYPQFLLAVSDDYSTSLVPLTEENKDEGQSWNQSIYDHVLLVMRKIFDTITEFVRMITDFVQSIKEA